MGKRTRNREQQAKKAANQRALIIGAIVVVAVALVAILMLNNQATNQAVKTIDRPNPAGMSTGDPNAPVKVEEYADFQCPYCAAFVQKVEPGIIENYVVPGKVYFTFIPYSFIGSESVRAAEAAYCAADQNKFWDLHDVLFSNQAGENTGGFADNKLIQLAQKAGLKMADFRPCFDNSQYLQQVKDDLQQGQTRGVTGTPYFFVNGQGPVDQSQLESAIQQALAGN
jgi:protein-disulfide isomerase